MKKVLCIVLALFPICLSAQSRFEPQVKVAYELGIDEDANQSFGAEFVAGYRITNAFRLGGGVGIYWCKHLYEDAHYNKYLNYYEKEYRETASYIPVYVNGKYNFLTTGKWRPFASFDAGYSIFNPYSDYAEHNKLGIFAKPSFGVDCNIGKADITFEIGYRYQDREFYDVKMGYSQLVMSFGFQF